MEQTEPIQVVRLGYTETTLLYIYWLEINNDEVANHPETITIKNSVRQWLHTTSGFYDNSHKEFTYFDNGRYKWYDSDTYKSYFSLVLNFVKNVKLVVSLHKQDHPVFGSKMNSFCNNFSCISNILLPPNLYSAIKDKSCLIISPFSPLMAQQYENGNVFKVNHKFPSVKQIQTYKFPYTFFNTGPHSNIIETAREHFKVLVSLLPVDTVVISCGAYSSILASFFYETDKTLNIICMGRELAELFGITKVSSGTYNACTAKECLITSVPDEYKPDGYMKIENGCYWP